MKCELASAGLRSGSKTAASGRFGGSRREVRDYLPIRITCYTGGMSQQAHVPRQRARMPNNRTTPGFRISDARWAVLQLLFPVHVNTHRCGSGRPRVPERACADASFYVLRTGCQWQALDQTELCAHATAHDRFQTWVEAGVFLELWQAGVGRFADVRGIEWDWLAMDGVMTKAPLGGGKTGPKPTDRGKCGVKRSVLTEGQGGPIGLVVEGANRHDMKLVRHTLENVVVARSVPPPEQSRGMCWDKGYDYEEVREILRAFGVTAHIRSRGEEATATQQEGGRKARRWVVERAHAWLNRFRRLLIRWDKKPENYLALRHCACGLIALRAAGGALTMKRPFASEGAP
jgi:putative transposase